MNNLIATRSLCNAIANTFYPDDSTIKLALFNAGLNEQDEATPKDPKVFRVASKLVMGYVEGSRSEGGVSTSVIDKDAVMRSLRTWCREYGLDADEELTEGVRVIEDGSNLW